VLARNYIVWMIWTRIWFKMDCKKNLNVCFSQDCNHTQNTDDSNSEQKNDKGQCEKEVVVMTKCAIGDHQQKNYSQVTAESKVINRNQFAINIQSLAFHCNGFSVTLNRKK